jgi:hypothetical protein
MVRKLIVEHAGYTYTHTYRQRGQECILLSTSKPNVIACLRTKPSKFKKPGKKIIEEHKADLQKTITLFEKFMAFRAEMVTGVDVPDYEMKRFGVAKYIIYESDKWFVNDEYEHDFGKGVNVYIPKKSSGMDPKFIILSGANLRITKRGIEG